MSTRRRILRALGVVGLSAAAFGAAAPPAAPPEPLTAGYDKGFFIKSEKFEARFGTRVQLQASSTEPDTFMFDSLLGSEQDTKSQNELFVRRLKLFASGFAIRPSIKWKVQLDVVSYRPGTGSTTGNVRLEEAFVDLTDRPWTQVRVGQFKVPFAYEKMTSSGKLNLVDRSIVHSFFGIEQEPGIDLYGQSFNRKIRYDVAVTTGVSDNKGFDTANETAANGESDFRYMVRGTWEPLAPYTWEQGAVSAPEKPELTLQLGVMSNRTAVPLDTDPFMLKDRILPFGRDVLGANSTTFDAATETSVNRWSGVSNSRKSYDRNEVELVLAYKYRRFSVEAQGIAGNVEPELRYLQGKDPDLRDLDFENRGLRLQSGLFVVPTKIEIAARWAAVDREAEAEFAANPLVKEEILLDEWRLGFNWYFAKHDWKWQVDVGQLGTERKLNGQRLAVPARVDFPGGVGFDDKVIQNNERKDTQLRTQFQLQF